MRQAFVRLSLRGRRFQLNATRNSHAKYGERYSIMKSDDPLYQITHDLIAAWTGAVRMAGGARSVADWGPLLADAAAKVGVNATWLAATPASPARAWLTFPDES